LGKSISLTQLMADVRFDFDLASTSSRLSDADLTRLINRSLDELFLYLVDCNCTYRDKVGTLTTTGGVSTVNLPTAFYSLKSLRLRVSDDAYPQLRAATPDEIQYDPATARAWGDGEALPIYWLAQNQLHFWPTPNAAYTLYIAYVEGFTDLVGGASLDAQPGWDAWVVQKCLMRLHRRQKDREAFDLAATELMRIEGQMQSALTAQDLASPPMVRRRSHFAERGPRLSTDRYYMADGED
jgi:hypothetical protein